MKKIKIFNTLLNIISITLYLFTTILTTYLLISYSIVEKTEGTGLIIALFYVFNSFECLIVILLNIIGITVTILNKNKIIINNNNNKSQYKKQLVMRLILIIVPILTFIIQIIISNIIN